MNTNQCRIILATLRTYYLEETDNTKKALLLESISFINAELKEIEKGVGIYHGPGGNYSKYHMELLDEIGCETIYVREHSPMDYDWYGKSSDGKLKGVSNYATDLKPIERAAIERHIMKKYSQKETARDWWFIESLVYAQFFLSGAMMFLLIGIQIAKLL